MVHLVVVALLVAAFLGAGLFNAIGTPAVRSDFVRWGFPGWWNALTGGLEIACAALIALPESRLWGLVLGALVIAAALLTVLRHREYKHLVPLALFGALIAFALATT